MISVSRFEIEKKLRAKRKDEQQRERRGSSRRYDSPGEQDDRYGRRRSRTRRRRYRSSRSSDSERGGGGANSSRSSSPHHSSRRHDNHRGNSPPVSSSSATAYSTAAAEFSDGGHRHQRSDRRKNMERGLLTPLLTPPPLDEFIAQLANCNPASSTTTTIPALSSHTRKFYLRHRHRIAFSYHRCHATHSMISSTLSTPPKPISECIFRLHISPTVQTPTYIPRQCHLSPVLLCNAS